MKGSMPENRRRSKVVSSVISIGARRTRWSIAAYRATTWPINISQRNCTGNLLMKPITFWVLSVLFLSSIDDVSAAAAPKIVLAHGALNARIAPLWIGHEQKFFAKYGVDSTVILVGEIEFMASAFGTGEIDFALSSGSTLLGAAAGGLDAKMIAALNGRVTYDLVAAPNIKSVKDLRGKRFGIQAFGGGLWMGAMLGLETLGVDPQRDNLNILQVGDQSVIAQALEAGSIDAAALDGVFSRRLKQKGFRSEERR